MPAHGSQTLGRFFLNFQTAIQVQPASADFPGFKDILPGNPEVLSEGVHFADRESAYGYEQFK